MTPVALVLRVGRPGTLTQSDLVGRLRVAVDASSDVEHAFIAGCSALAGGAIELQAVLYVLGSDHARAVGVVAELSGPLVDAGATLVTVLPAPWGHGQMWP
ncbi:hypothetical protein [Humibacillus xanthopallidus]|uniref:Uncharacterized protein n=1 Tax=Humibacillus xanthopallidus TaxID=412689 RepID=A0A543I2A3_9MICO|nr:hypothetical protein [Humibacillus xanthopallidus]TQM64725.1 hypothetical protein FBY41_1104 [Humibacillus xanthopallidus]